MNVLLSIPHGLLLGGTYGALALGLSVIFGVTRVINFAHGSMLMVSCFGYYILCDNFNIEPYVGIIIVIPVMFFFGYMIQKILIKPLILRERADVLEPTSVMMMTIGLDFALMNLFMMIFGSTYHTVQTPVSQAVLDIGDATFTTQWTRVISAIVAVTVATLLWFTINKTELGARIRAVSQNRDASALCGVDVYKTYSIAFGLGIAAVSIAGASLTQFLFVQPQIGQTFGIKCFMIVVLGGLGSVPGALAGGIIFGLIETIGAQFITSSSASILSFVLFILVLLIRPAGLFGKSKS